MDAKKTSANILADILDDLITLFNGSPPIELPTGHPANSIPVLLEVGLRDILGENEWARFEQALPSEQSRPEFFSGIVKGAAMAYVESVTEDIQLARAAVSATIEFYKIVYDPDMWTRLLTAWIDETTPPSDVMNYVQQKHPNIYDAVISAANLSNQFDSFVKNLSDDTQVAGGWTRAQELVIGFWSDIARGFGQILRDRVDEVITHKGDSEEQGYIIGKALGSVIIEVLAIALGLYALIRSAAKATGKAALRAARNAFSPKEVALLRDRAIKITPEIVESANKFRHSAKEAERIYDSLAHRIQPYKVLKKETGEFNKVIRDTYGYKIADIEYVELRLDAHHIVEDTWYATFRNEFRTKLGWQSGEDMDCIALHTTWHIRSGERLSVRYGLRGAENEASLSKALSDIIKEKEPPGGFTSARQLVESYEHAYLKYTPELYEKKLKDWFSVIKSKL